MTYLIKKESWRPSFGFLLILFMLFITTCICYAHSIYEVKQGMKRRPVKMAAVAVVGSSDLALNTAARHIRHVSLTDVSTAFQDCPSCLDYFPGALGANPPDYLGINTSFE
jgi:hypothetical protein